MNHNDNLKNKTKFTQHYEKFVNWQPKSFHLMPLMQIN